jgi:hypothetical protein
MGGYPIVDCVPVVSPGTDITGEEERLWFPGDPGHSVIIIVSGYMEPTFYEKGSDDVGTTREAHLVVGPYCEGIIHVSPLATVAEFIHYNSDEDDNSMWAARSCPWDIVAGLDGVPASYERVLLKPQIGHMGENAKVTLIGYHAAIEARTLIDITKPGPAHY